MESNFGIVNEAETNSGTTFLEKIPPPLKPEIIANSPLKNLKLMFSTPVYNEWENGNLQKSVKAVLSQHQSKNTAVEANYIINLGYKDFGNCWIEQPEESYHWVLDMEKIKNDSRLSKLYESTQQSNAFLRKIIDIQKIAREIVNSKSVFDLPKRRKSQEELNRLITEEQDPQTREIFQLAANKAETIGISAIDTTNANMVALNYHPSLAGARTAGMDYAYCRLPSDGIYFMYDADTVPATNHFSQEVIDIFEKHPELYYLFVRMSYQPPGSNKALATDSPYFSMHHAEGYNLDYVPQSPQICFRKSCIEDLRAIEPFYDTGYYGHDDTDTAIRLVGIFGSLEKGLLFRSDALVTPVSLTTDRMDGFADAFERDKKIADHAKENLKLQNLAMVLEEKKQKIEKKIEGQPDVKDKEKVQHTLVEARERYQKHQRKMNRVNRIVAKEFIRAFDAGEIPKLQSEAIDQEKILKRPFGKMLLAYINTNREFLTELSEEDISLIRYYLDPKAIFPENITELSPFQQAIREYIGEYADFSDYESTIAVEGEVRTFLDPRSKKDRRSLWHGMSAELLALGSIDFQFFHVASFESTLLNGRKYWDPRRYDRITNTPQERAQWINEEMDSRIAKNSRSNKSWVQDFLSKLHPAARILIS